MSTSAEPRPSRHRRGGVVAMVAAAVSLLAALAFPFAPVGHEDVTYRWESGPGTGTAVAIPMLPYQPLRLEVSVSCAVLEADPDGGDVFSTVPPRTDPRAERLPGLQIAAVGTQAVTVNIGSVTHAAAETGTAANQVLNAATELSRQSDALSAAVAEYLATVEAA